MQTEVGFVGCPVCHTVLNAQQAKCNSLWHSANRDGLSIIPITLDFSEGICGESLPGGFPTVCGIPKKDSDELHRFWGGHVARVADGHRVWPVRKNPTPEEEIARFNAELEQFRAYMQENFPKVVEQQGSELKAAIYIIDLAKASISALWPKLVEQLNSLLGVFRRAGIDIRVD